MNEAKESNSEQVKGRKGFWNKFVKFLAMGGFIIIIALGIGIAIVIDYLLKK